MILKSIAMNLKIYYNKINIASECDIFTKDMELIFGHFYSQRFRNQAAKNNKKIFTLTIVDKRLSND